MELLFTVHRYVGYAVFLVLVVAAATAFRRGRRAQEFSRTPFSMTAVLLDIQVLIGIALYVAERYWEATESLVVVVHPALMIFALVVAHVGVSRGALHQMVEDAHRAVGRAFVFASVVVAAGIGVVSVPT